MNRSIPISDSYRKPIFDAVLLQIILGILSMMVLDGGDCAHISGAALLAFWCGTAVLIWRHPSNPSKVDLKFIQFGYLPVLVFAFVAVHLVWAARGV
ncbi:MAG TPA: hypothetical protein VK742_00195 [Candidatus Sulfotelmatobacter sp.]|jgi:hypothetical protein|nr:hypothetical protein [Candidatus Sulfotelmatobacter sp.]